MQGQAADAPLSIGVKEEDKKNCSKKLQQNIDKNTRKRSYHKKETEKEKTKMIQEANGGNL